MEEIKQIRNQLKLILDGISRLTKEVLNLDEVSELTSLKPNYIYKLNHEGKIPSYSYSEKGKLYFKRSEILEWMTQTKRFYKDDISNDLISYA